ncbi:MAG TPA: hypothetical protein V6C97_00975 [Oculatellaceae cyanobacterium]
MRHTWHQKSAYAIQMARQESKTYEETQRLEMSGLRNSHALHPFDEQWSRHQKSGPNNAS